MGFVLMLHSLNRWLVILIALVTIVRLGMVWLKVRPAAPLDVQLLRVYSIDLGIQFVLGLIFLIWSGVAGAGLPGYRIGHAVVMIVAIAVAGMAMRWRDAEGTLRARNGLLAVVVSLVLIFVGVSLLPGGWMR